MSRLLDNHVNNPKPQAERQVVFFILVLLFAQALLLLLWELLGHGLFVHAVTSNPDPLDRTFYGRIAASLRPAMIVAVMFTASFLLPQLRRLFANLLLSRRLFAFVLSLSATLQLLLVFLLPTPPFSDAAFYVEHAQRLLGTGSYVAANGDLTAFWPVGYPAVLAVLGLITGDMLLAGRLLNVAANLGLIVLSYRLFSPMLSPRGRGAFLLLMALHPIVLLSSVVLMTEQLFSLLLWSSIWLLLRTRATWWRAALMGVLLGAGVYLRPATLLYLVALVLYMLWSTRNYRHAIIVVVAAAAMLAPWAVRNWEVFGRFVPVSTNGGFNFLMGNHNAANGGVNFDFTYNPRNLDEADASADAVRRGLREITNDPLSALARLPKKLLHAYIRFDAPLVWAVKPLPHGPPGWLSALLLYVTNGLGYLMIPAVFLGLLRKRSVSDDPSTYWLIVLFYATTLVIVLVFYGTDRYLLPMLPVHVFFFAKMLTVNEV